MIIIQCNSKEKYVNKVKELLRAAFARENLSNEVFERWFNTANAIHTDNLIATMCQRAIQAGCFVYPYKNGKKERIGYLSAIKDYEIEGLVCVKDKEFIGYPGKTLLEKFCYAEKLIAEKFD